MEKNDEALDIFLILSKIIFIITILVIIIWLILRFNQKEMTAYSLKTLITPTLTTTPLPTQQLSEIKLDLKGPFVCQSEIDQASVSAYIQDKKIRLIITEKKETNNILLSGDCYYKWTDDQYNGEKVCGLSPLISMAESMMQFSGVGFNSLIHQLGLNGSQLKSSDKLTSFVRACKKEEISNADVFIVPSNILFKNNLPDSKKDLNINNPPNL